MRGANSPSSARRFGQRIGHLAEDVQAAVLGLAERDLHDLLGDAVDLDVHLQGGDAADRAGDLEVHVAEVIFVTQDVGEHREALAFLDQAHGDAGDRLAERNAGIHQRQRGAADGRHRGRAVGLGDLGDDAQRVGEGFGRRQHRADGAPGELAVADFAAAGRTHAAGLTDRIGREVVVEKELLLVHAGQAVDILLVLAGAERRNDERLGLAAGEQRRTVRARQDADFRDDLADRRQVAAVDAGLGVEDVPANDLGLQFLEHRGDLLGRVFRSFVAVRREGCLDLGLDRVDGGVACLLVDVLVGVAQFVFDDLQHLGFERRSSPEA